MNSLRREMTGKMEGHGSASIDVSGLNTEDRIRIKQIGFDAWLDELLANPKMTGKRKVTKQEPKTVLAAPAPVVQSKVKPGSGGYIEGMTFLGAAKKHKNEVTYDQAAALNPKNPNDPVAWARAMGAQVKTLRKEKKYVVEKYI